MTPRLADARAHRLRSGQAGQAPELSIVSTLFRSAETIEDFCRRAAAAASELSSSFEIVLVNDGSPDDSLQRALALLPQAPHLVIVDLARNFGHHRAMMAGLARARGERVFLIDSDLEEDPAWLRLFDEVQRNRGSDVVYGVQDTRKGGVVERLMGSLFYKTINVLFDFPIPENVVTARLMTRRYVRALVAHRERTFAIAGLWAMTGFDQVAVPIRKGTRATSTYGVWRRASALVNAVTAFTARPLVWIFYLGVFIMAISSLVAGYLATARLFYGQYLEGWVSVFVSIWFLGGLTIFCLGLIGIYLSKVFEEAKRRPYVTVRAVHRHEAHASPRNVESAVPSDVTRPALSDVEGPAPTPVDRPARSGVEGPALSDVKEPAPSGVRGRAQDGVEG